MRGQGSLEYRELLRAVLAVLAVVAEVAGLRVELPAETVAARLVAEEWREVCRDFGP